MEWNKIGWKCKRQKKFIDFFILASLALIVLVIILTGRLKTVEYVATADLAAEAAVPSHWTDVYNYDIKRMQNEISALEETCARLESALAELQH